MGDIKKEEFTGFEFGGKHSSEFGIYRVSGGDRYDDTLHPEIKDRTTEVPGLNGEYYFGSDFGTRAFDIEIAFDHLTETQFREFRRFFGTKSIKELIFDEHPYKKYMAKLESPVELSYVCFDEPNYTWQQFDGIGRTQSERADHDRKVYDGTMRRIYKGEGKMTFICYFPFAKSVFKVLPDEESDEWAISSGILSQQDYQREGIDSYNNGTIKVYNPGDVETGFKLYVPASALNQTITVSYGDAQLVIDPIQLKSNSSNSTDVGVIIDTNTGLINGLASFNNGTSYTISNNIYNGNVKAGYFFKLQPNELNEYSTIQIQPASTGFQIFYDYLYF